MNHNVLAINVACVTGDLGLLEARSIRYLSHLRGKYERLEVAPTSKLLASVVSLKAARYQLGQLHCVDAVLQSSEMSTAQQVARIPDQSTVSFKSSVPDDDYRPETIELETIAADPARPLVLLTGCFDLIHAGHMRLIEIAAELGARPVVAALTTNGIRVQPKNADGDRPFWSMADRLIVLSELRSNPRVMFFDGPDCLELIERLKPDVFVKEERDRSREIVQREARLVEQLGGQLMWVKDNRFGHMSSTKIAEAIRASQRSASEVSHGH